MEWTFHTKSGHVNPSWQLKLSFNTSFKILKIFPDESENAPKDFDPKGEISNSIAVHFGDYQFPTSENLGITIEAEKINGNPPQITELVWYDKSQIETPLGSEAIEKINKKYFNLPPTS